MHKTPNGRPGKRRTRWLWTAPLWLLALLLALGALAPLLGLGKLEVGPVGFTTARFQSPSYEQGWKVTSWEEGWYCSLHVGDWYWYVWQRKYP